MFAPFSFPSSDHLILVLFPLTSLAAARWILLLTFFPFPTPLSLSLSFFSPLPSISFPEHVTFPALDDCSRDSPPHLPFPALSLSMTKLPIDPE